MTDTKAPEGIEWGPVLGGVASDHGSYREEDNLLRKGDWLRIHIPGLFQPIEAQVILDRFAKVHILGQDVMVSDRSNGYQGKPGQMWSYQIGTVTPTRVDAIKALPEGTLFFISPPSIVHREVYVRTDTGTTNITRGLDVPINEVEFGTANATEGFPYVIGKQV